MITEIQKNVKCDSCEHLKLMQQIIALNRNLFTNIYNTDMKPVTGCKIKDLVNTLKQTN